MLFYALHNTHVTLFNDNKKWYDMQRILEYWNCFDLFAKTLLKQKKKNLRVPGNFRFVTRCHEDETRGGRVHNSGSPSRYIPGDVLSVLRRPRGSDITHANLTLTSRNI